MAYYIAEISVSLFADSESELNKKVKNILKNVRENTECSPYVNQIKRITNNPENREINIDSGFIKNVNQKNG